MNDQGIYLIARTVCLCFCEKNFSASHAFSGEAMAASLFPILLLICLPEASYLTT